MTILVSALGGGGAGFKLAENLTWPSESQEFGGARTLTFNPSGGLTTALSLTGKWAISFLELFNITNAETYTVKLTVDSVVVWNDTFASVGTSAFLTGSSDNDYNDVVFECGSSMLLEVQSTVDTSVQLRYKVRPIT